jgi:transposase
MIALLRYLKKLSEELIHIKETKFQSGVFKTINIYFQDESRFGLLTVPRRMLTIKGIKPLMPYQHKFKNFYLFGAFSPITGTHFTLELPKCNSDCFQLYLDEFSQQNPDEFKIVFLDNGAFHKAKELDIPANIVLLFIPPYSPELNPAEKMWRYFKDRIANEIFKTLDDLSSRLSQLIIDLKNETIISITAYDYYIKKFNAVF